MKNNKFYITTPIYYVNSKPHLGTLYSTLLADVVARYKKLCGKDVFFLTGSDEHGQKLAKAAEDANRSPKEFVDSIVKTFKDMWNLYELEYDKFIRTTDKEHEDAVSAWIKKLQNNGDIYKSTYEGWYCVPCETFITIDSKAKEKPVCPQCQRDLIFIEEEGLVSSEYEFSRRFRKALDSLKIASALRSLLALNIKDWRFEFMRNIT